MKMLIGGMPTAASDGAEFDVVNPATLEVIDRVPMATPQDVDATVANAVLGSKEWGARLLFERIDIIKKFLALYADNRDKIVGLLQAETGKTNAAATGCVDGSLALGEHYVELSRTFGGETFPAANRDGAQGTLILTVHEPLGIVVCVLPFNFPIDSFMHKIVPALLMGNAVIIKPSSDTPMTDLFLTQLLLDAGVPGNAVQCITGSGSKIGDQLTSDPRIALVNLTGSTAVGVQIAKSCAEHLHRTHLELGGNDPFIVLPDADIEEAALLAFNSRNGNSGQVCCAGKRFIVPAEKYDEFVGLLKAHLATMVVGDPTKDETTCGPLISVKAAEKLEKQIADAVAAGDEIIVGGKKMEGAFFTPTILKITKDSVIAHDLELFGPVWSVITYETVDEAVAIANDTAYGLSSGIVGKDMKQMIQTAMKIEAGTVVIGGSGAYRTSDQPFGGYKMSGLGREGGRATLEELTQKKTIVFQAGL